MNGTDAIFHFRLPVRLLKELQKCAASEQRTVASLIRKIAVDYLAGRKVVKP